MSNRTALQFVAPRRVVVVGEEMPQPGPEQILVKTRLSAVSAGTELLAYRGQLPADLAVDDTLASLEGAFAYPFKYGYAAVGTVIDQGEGLGKAWRGRRVFAFNPHESHFVAAASDVVPIPDDIADEAAAMLPSMETAVSLVMDGRPVLGEQVAIFGLGVVGLLTTALLARFPLDTLLALDPVESRQDWATKLGATETVDPFDLIALGQVAVSMAQTEGYDGADLVYELSGSPEALNRAVELTGYSGRIIVGSWYGSKPVSLDLGGRFHRGRMRLISSQVSRLDPGLSGRWTKRRRLALAVAMLRRLQPQQLITHRVSIDEAASAYELLDGRPADALQVILTYEN